MAPAVPFALVGVVQLTAVAVWLGVAGAVSFPRLRRRVTPLFVLGALAMAVADAVTAVRFGTSRSDPVAWLRVAGLALLAIGATRGSGQSLVAPSFATGAVVVPLGAAPTPSLVAGAVGVLGGAGAWLRGRRPGADRWLGALLATGLALSGVAAALAGPARDDSNAALAVLASRAAATVALIGALVLLARLLLVGKIVGSILAGVVAMAVAAVGVVGTGVASEVQSEQSQRLLQVAKTEQANLGALATRAILFAQVVAQCPRRNQLDRCVTFLKLFSDQPDYFGAVVRRGKGAVIVAPDSSALNNAALVQLAGSTVVQDALQRGASSQSAPSGPMILDGSPSKLVVVAAVPGRPANTSGDARVRPTFAAVYGIGIGDDYLSSPLRSPGYDVSVIVGDRVLASSLDARGGRAVLAEARAAHVASADPSVEKVVPAETDRPTVALVPVTSAGNGDVRIATLAVSQPANEALSAQRAVLRRLFLTALLALIVVALLAIALAQRIAEPVRRLTIAAGQVRRGELDTQTTVGSRDEVGRLSRAFDAMTASLRTLTADLRSTAEQEQTLRARLETVVSSMTDGLLVTDANWKVTSVNPTAAQLMGRDADDLVGKSLNDVLTAEDNEGRPALRGANRRTVDAELVRADGDRLPVRIGVAPLADGQGRVVVLSDRSREHEVDRMKTEFLANISHELRTPLTPIRGYAEMIARRPELSRKQVETFLDEILNSTGRMSRAVELLVDVAALEGGRIVPQHSRITARSFVDERVETWKARYPERADDFKRRVATKLPPLDIDRHWVGRALDEFADNAVKYTDRGTAITLTATAVDDDASMIRLAVKDAGAGFDPQRAAELVGDFSQADASETRRVGGLGLGLGFVNRVAERFGLELSVETQPGKGSEFALLVPTADGVGS
ncbi:MAG TPA: ATP-binding protein [Mycobacteriales bacterium]|nr:ATP-binding protein [Mycobacteriales bacterium]